MTTRVKASGAALLILAFSSVSPGATEYTVSTLEELTNALNTVSGTSGEAVVTIAEGVYDLSEMTAMHSDALLSVAISTTKRKVTIQGDPAVLRENVVLDAGSAGRVMRLYAYGDTSAVITLRNLTIKNGYTTGECGGVRTTNWGRFNFENCVFEGNQAITRSSAAGGTGDRYFTNCLFRRNICGGTSGGGGVINDPKGVVGCTFVENGAYGDQLKGVAVNASCMITNCVFDSNCNTGRWGCASAVYLTGSGSIVDCTLTNNYFGTSTTEGGAVEITGSGSIVNCRFYNNKAGADGGAVRCKASGTPGVISGCMFANNSATGTKCGGGIALFPGLITNCTFVGNSGYYGGAVYNCTNVVDCVFAGNTAVSNDGKQDGGAGYMSVFRDCVITNNFGTYMCGAFSKCSAYRCMIGDNHAVNSQGERTVEANDSYFEDCELFGLRIFGFGWSNCGFNRCIVRDNVFTGGYGYMIGGTLSVTNTLFLRNEMYRMFTGYAADYDNTIVSCTFVSNTYDILATSSASGSPTLRVFNNLFVGTKTRTWIFDDDIGQAFAGSVFSNNYISTSQPYIGGGNINARAASAPKPRLMMDRDPLHPYAPDRASVLNGAGLVEDWMSDAIDLAGNERLSDGKVAIGAYETTDRGPFPGFSIIFR